MKASAYVNRGLRLGGQGSPASDTRTARRREVDRGPSNSPMTQYQRQLRRRSRHVRQLTAAAPADQGRTSGRRSATEGCADTMSARSLISLGRRNCWRKYRVDAGRGMRGGSSIFACRLYELSIGMKTTEAVFDIASPIYHRSWIKCRPLCRWADIVKPLSTKLSGTPIMVSPRSKHAKDPPA